MLVTPVGPMSDATAGGRARGSKLRSMFTDSECFLREVRESAGQRLRMEKKWSAAHCDRYGTGELAPAISAVPWASPETSAGPIAGGRTVGARYRALEEKLRDG